MSWIKQSPRTHKCPLPDKDYRIGHGSLWRCDECGTLWKYYGDGHYGHWNYPPILTLWYWLKDWWAK